MNKETSEILLGIWGLALEVALGIYYSLVIWELICKSYYNKKDFLIDLLPFGKIIRLAIKEFRNLD